MKVTGAEGRRLWECRQGGERKQGLGGGAAADSFTGALWVYFSEPSWGPEIKVRLGDWRREMGVPQNQLAVPKETLIVFWELRQVKRLYNVVVEEDRAMGMTFSSARFNGSRRTSKPSGTPASSEGALALPAWTCG